MALLLEEKINMRKERSYYPTNAPSITTDEWLDMLKENDCFTLILLEAIYTLVFEMNGKGSALNISEITGRPHQAYNLSLWRTIKRLRKRGYTFVADIKKDGKERYWSHFFKGYSEDGAFIWEVKDTLRKAFIEYVEMPDRTVSFVSNSGIIAKDESIEGMRRQRIHFQIERNSAIVNLAKKNFLKKHGTLFCEACDFSFKQTYGIDFIEAHHILPLYKGTRWTKEQDLIMLCANCHRAVHSERWRERPIDDFLEYIRKRTSK
ncbi:HNH endonuclease [Rummeliibacillus sp. SL167]|uniref:HNH endonuclease n=1 Tax=Rummeliibacillus sp. SL167 TaxID=2579792 RepID=UPI0011B53F82|nr:HNH endonuclease [Rummeliibacillus sp. SL167]